MSCLMLADCKFGDLSVYTDVVQCFSLFAGVYGEPGVKCEISRTSFGTLLKKRPILRKFHFPISHKISLSIPLSFGRNNEKVINSLRT